MLAGRLLVNGFGTGVEVSPPMVHGGAYPATADGRGLQAIGFCDRSPIRTFQKRSDPRLCGNDGLTLDAKQAG